MPTSHLVLGGARSGKSRHAAEWVLAHPGPHTYLATAHHEPSDPEMHARIAHHRQDRAHQGWLTVEEPLDIMQLVRDAVLGAVLIDCATLWLTNLALKHAWDERAVLAEVDLLCAVLAYPSVDIAVVSNEVGHGIVPVSEQGRAFRDLQGFANQRLAAACAHVTLLVAGLPLSLKPRSRLAHHR